MTKTEKLYRKGYLKVKEELDIVYILKTIHKLKAGLTAKRSYN